MHTVQSIERIQTHTRERNQELPILFASSIDLYTVYSKQDCHLYFFNKIAKFNYPNKQTIVIFTLFQMKYYTQYKYWFQTEEKRRRRKKFIRRSSTCAKVKREREKQNLRQLCLNMNFQLDPSIYLYLNVTYLILNTRSHTHSHTQKTK